MNAHASPPPAPRVAPPALSTTAYAILGMLAVRPWTAYELTRQLRRSLSYCWPKAESVLYSEPKRLVSEGLASARTEANGRRTRAVYEITEDGRRALAAWLATDPAPPRFEQESILRLIYADHGTTKDLLDAVHATREWAIARMTEGTEQVRGYLADGGPFPDRLHLIALFARYYADLFEAILDWTALAEREISTWPRTDGLGMTTGARALLEELSARFETLLASAEPSPPGRSSTTGATPTGTEPTDPAPDTGARDLPRR
jgi:DNA-binding PadR family transcriptional regulator